MVALTDEQLKLLMQMASALPVIEQERRETEITNEIKNYRGPATIHLPAGQTLNQWLAEHPDYSPAMWTLKAGSERNVRFMSM